MFSSSLRLPLSAAACFGLLTFFLPQPSTFAAKNAPTENQNLAVNLAPAASASASYHSGDTSVAALSDGFTPDSSQDRGHGAYGNWPHTGTEWVEYTWSRPISTREVSVY